MNTGARLPVHKPDSSFNLTNTESKRNILRMARLTDIQKALKNQISDEARHISKLNDEMNELRPAYKRYIELSKESEARVDRIRSTLGLLAGDLEFDDLRTSEDCLQFVGINVGESLTEKWKNPLWKFMREIVRQVPELQIVELEALLIGLGIKTSRQSIESALESHREVFRMTKRGRDKFVSLKGA